jgi:Transposase DDE domain
MHVVTTRRQYTDRSGVTKTYRAHLLRRSFREGGKVKNETLGNLSALPDPAVDAVKAVLRGQLLTPAGSPGEAVEIVASLPHGHVAAVVGAARRLGFPELLGPPCRLRDLAFALLVARVVRPRSKLATTRWWADTTLAADLGVADASTDEVYAALDWLLGRQDAVEAALAARHLTPGGMALFDLSSSYLTGSHCPLAAFGYSRDRKRGYPQVNYGLLTDPDGRPVAVRVFAGNTADPAAFSAAVDVVRDKFGLTDLVLVGDRGMITSARIAALRELGGFGWVTALRAPDVAALAADAGPLQFSLFDQANLAEITHPDYPGERLVACRNPALADERARKRAALLAATDADLGKVVAAVAAGRLVDPDKIGIRIGKVIDRRKMGKHYLLDIRAGHFTFTHDQAGIDAEAALDGIYVLRTSVTAHALPSADVVRAYKNLAHVERDFGSLKTIDLDLRPIRHYTADRVRAHVWLCALAAYLVWHLRRDLAPLTFTDETPPTGADPVAPACRSAAADRKASRQTHDEGSPVYSFRGLLDHLATLTRNILRFPALPDTPTVEQLAVPTPTQRRAFQLLDTAVPLRLT